MMFTCFLCYRQIRVNHHYADAQIALLVLLA